MFISFELFASVSDLNNYNIKLVIFSMITVLEFYSPIADSHIDLTVMGFVIGEILDQLFFHNPAYTSQRLKWC